jgi:RNA polymerase sigma factor (sigma-70 family)
VGRDPQAPPATGMVSAAAISPVEEIYRAQYQRLVRYAYLLTGQLAEAEDAVQDAFVVLQRRPAIAADPDQARAYLHVVLLNRTRGAHRRVRREASLHGRLRLLASEAAPAADAVIGTHDDLVAAVNALPRRQREVVALRYWAGLSEREIAVALGVTPGTVKSASARALRSLSRKVSIDAGGVSHDR